MTYPNPRPVEPVHFRWQDPANMVLAVWLFISPWVLQFGSNASTAQPVSGAAAVNAVSNAAWNAWVLAVIVFLVALSALGSFARYARGQEWINLLLGIWIFVAPWALGFAYGPFPAASWDHWVVGALIFLVSLSGLSMLQRGPATGVPRDFDHEPQRR